MMEFSNFSILLTKITEGYIFPTFDMEFENADENDEEPDYHHSVFKRSSSPTSSPTSSPAYNHSDMSHITVPANYSIHDPPPTVGGKGTLVEFAVLIFSVRDIKEISEELSLEMRLQLGWKDKRLLPWVDYIEKGKKYMVLNPKIMEKLWYPDIFIDYVKSIAQPTILAKPASLRLYNDTGLRYSTRVTVTMSCPMAFHYYPADTQKCNVDMKSYAYNDFVLRLDWSKKKPLVLLKPNLDLPNFHLELANPEVTSVQTSAGFYSGIRFTVLLRRSMKFHLIQTYLPSTLFVIVSWLSFLVPPEMVPGRMAICMTTLLTLTTMFSAVRQNTPRVSYIKALDIWMVTCAFFVFLTLVEYTFVLNLRTKKANNEKKRAAKAAAFACTLIGQEQLNPEKLRTMPDVSQNQTQSQSQNQTQPEEYKPSGLKKFIFIFDELIEKFTWGIIVGLFSIFNCIYWPWLLISSGYYETLGTTKFYGEETK